MKNRHALDIYITEIMKYDPLPPEEEVQEFLKMQAGDLNAREKIIKHNLRFVVQVAKKLSPYNMPSEDAIQAGTIGLIKAVDGKYDPSRGFKFISYAVKSIKWAIKNIHKRDYARIIRAPGSRLGQNAKTMKLEEELSKVYEHDQLPESFIEKEFERRYGKPISPPCQETRYRNYSLDARVGFEMISSPSLIDILKNPNSEDSDWFITPESQKEISEIILGTLTPLQATISEMQMRSMNDEVIAENLGCEHQNVQQRRATIRKNANKMKTYFENIYGPIRVSALKPNP